METHNDRGQDRKEILAHIDSVFQAFIQRDEAAIHATHLPEWKGFTVRSRATVRRRIDGCEDRRHAFGLGMDHPVFFYEP